MLFPTITFALFFMTVFVLYWFVFSKNLKIQNLLLVISSYLFYGWWDWRFLALLFLVATANYFIAIRMNRQGHRSFRKRWLISGLIINIGTLVIFKYFGFFTEEFIRLMTTVGLRVNPITINIIQPLGISFYIFLAISYHVDVFQRKIPAEKNIVNVALSLSFFPIILAGPVHRPAWLLPQIKRERVFDKAQAYDGLKQILWGLFMKIVIADHCADHVNTIFHDIPAWSGSTLLLGMLLFTIQIYADFAGYSHMAIGLGKLLGFRIIQNFDYPYFARDIRQFWQKWNISLTRWFRDYLFLPIAFSLSRKLKQDRIYGINTDLLIYITGITVTWTVTGLWHGANFTFIIWGMIHGGLLILFQIFKKTRKRILQQIHVNNKNTCLKILDTGFTFTLIMFSWVFFRASTIGDAGNYIVKIFSPSLFTIPRFTGDSNLFKLFLIITAFMVIEWIGRKQEYPISTLGQRWPRILRWSLYYIIILFIIFFTQPQQPFIYFQF